MKDRHVANWVVLTRKNTMLINEKESNKDDQFLKWTEQKNHRINLVHD